jgi:hypothetical protein
VSADQRVTLAAEYLASARQRDISFMPPSRMAAELAETRRQLGLVLAAIEDVAPALTNEQRLTVLSALADAEVYRTERAAEWCDACETAPEGACREHVDDLDDADAYRQLAREIGGQQ